MVQAEQYTSCFSVRDTSHNKRRNPSPRSHTQPPPQIATIRAYSSHPSPRSCPALLSHASLTDSSPDAFPHTLPRPRSLAFIPIIPNPTTALPTFTPPSLTPPSSPHPPTHLRLRSCSTLRHALGKPVGRVHKRPVHQLLFRLRFRGAQKAPRRAGGSGERTE